MRNISILIILCSAAGANAATSINLGTASSFAVLGASTVTNTGPTVIFGNLGVAPGTAITGFPPGIVTGGTINAGNAVAIAAHNDLATAIVAAAGQSCGTTLTGQDLGGLTLVAGSYCFASSAQLTGTLTLDAQGNPNAVFLFQIGSTLTTASGSAVVLLGPDLGSNVFWQVGSSATLGTTTAFAGNILAISSITLNTGATLQCGRALARDGAVTMDTNVVSIDSLGCSTGVVDTVPEPGVWAMLITGFGLIGAALRRRRFATA